MNGAATKLAQLQKLQAEGVLVPPFWTEPPDRFPVLGRQLNGFRGRDIVKYDKPPVGYHPLFTQYLNKQREFRVHVFTDSEGNRRVHKTQEKKDGDKNKVAWNLASGFRFVFPGKDQVPKGVRTVARQSIAALDLDFGAVDIITADGCHYVLEVNTAPGLCEANLELYARVLEEYYL